MLVSFVHWLKDIYSGHTKKPLNDTKWYISAATNKKDVNKPPAHTISIQTVTDGITDGRHYIRLILVDHISLG